MTERMAYRIVSALAAIIGLVLVATMVLPPAREIVGELGGRWERTEGRVIGLAMQPAADFRSSFLGGGPRGEATVEYRAEGQVHSVRAALVPDGRDAEAQLARLRERGVTVSYRPGRPQEARVEGEGVEAQWSVVGLVLGIVFAALAGYTARRLWRESHHARATR